MTIKELLKNPETGGAEYRNISDHHFGFFPDFPVLIESDGTPWTLGNLYLTRRLEYNSKYEAKTYQNITNDLLAFLRWLEEYGIDPLDFHPRLRSLRPTYRYRDHLMSLAGNEAISKSTAASRMATVQAFYKGLRNYGIIENGIVDLAWETKTVLIKIVGRDMINASQLKQVETTNLVIKRDKSNKDPKKIRDGGSLRPLSQAEQDILLKYVRESGATYGLMFATAILTGARLQTICTLRGSTLSKAHYLKDQNTYVVNLPSDGFVNTKGGRAYTLRISKKLHQALADYWESAESVSKRKTSYYGDTADNYLFLNRDSMPYYTSRIEIKDRRDPSAHRLVGNETALFDKTKKRDGKAVQAYINNVLLPRIRKDHPDFKDFSFHDLRATFGTNLVRELLKSSNEYESMSDDKKKNYKNHANWALTIAAERMNHSDLQTTQGYIDFVLLNDHKTKTQADVEDILMSKVDTSILEYDHEQA